ncbi:MBL fold metallo-hydrolase [Planktothrix mougeotii]|uniref:MBL fold metallo-hydrolase n=1 Tax=Planktothrix mougeotii LEGE 06226 TaxID=1828728 RepID=A0ABR9UCY7_9CYAN|nr:MBL fold metallo-hydrolase [Planktothrix mougeotii]MBE9144323.1 MBL fold metallo-hydrolase [Planktothrix mougeotii LEGE 06226]
MAKFKLRRSQNVSGNFYVDETCIDCDTCRWMAPEVFNRENEQSAVYHQPTTQIEQEHALQALLSCPTASIGSVEKPSEIVKIQQMFPLLIEDNVYHCGYHSQASFAATSYFIQYPQGNILVDSPRFTPALVKRLEALGGVRWMYLTHQDDVADHQKFHDHFGCDRILHQDEIQEGTKDIEVKLIGTDNIQLSDDLLIIPVPGHTKGHTVLLYQNKFLFTGDHLAWSNTLQQLYAFPDYCWYSWTTLINSMQKLLNYSFEWVLPGHGRRYHTDAVTMQQQLQICISWMETQNARKS